MSSSLTHTKKSLVSSDSSSAGSWPLSSPELSHVQGSGRDFRSVEAKGNSSLWKPVCVCVGGVEWGDTLLLYDGSNVSGPGPQSTDNNVEGKSSGLWEAMCHPIDLILPSEPSFLLFGE